MKDPMYVLVENIGSQFMRQSLIKGLGSNPIKSNVITMEEEAMLLASEVFSTWQHHVV